MVAYSVSEHPLPILENRPVGPGLYWLVLDAAAAPEASVHVWADCRPGQFVMLDIPSPVSGVVAAPFAFRRPFSLMDVQVNRSELHFLYKVVGAGTEAMAARLPGQHLGVLGPLGKGFPGLLPPHHATAALPAAAVTLMIAGGIGIAPFYYVSCDMRRKYAGLATPPQPLRCLYGARTAADLGPVAALAAGIGPLVLTTNDGSHGGPPGTVVDALNAQPALMADVNQVFVCGPTRMMDAVVAWMMAHHPDVPVWVSLETPMPCGTGACSGCVMPRVVAGGLPAKICVEGPVMPARSLIWPLGTWPEDASMAASSSSCAAGRESCPPA
jgi:dihydroorotate dehydrogenase electron transfer subunit